MLNIASEDGVRLRSYDHLGLPGPCAIPFNEGVILRERVPVAADGGKRLCGADVHLRLHVPDILIPGFG